MPTRLPARVNADPVLRRRGRYLDADMLLVIGDARWLVPIRDGVIGDVRAASPVMNSTTFTLRITEEAWRQFLQPVPPPGFHDVMAMLRMKHLTLEGNLHPFMSHLLWFKAALASLREAA